MIVHFYTAKRGIYNPAPKFKLLCTGDWVESREYPHRGFVATPWNTTCPTCLDILIPKLEAHLALMKATRNENKKSDA